MSRGRSAVFHTRKLRVPLYNNRVVLILSDSAKEVNAFLAECSQGEAPADIFIEDADLYASVTHGVYIQDGLDHECQYVVFNHKNPYKKLSYGTIAHEAYHVLGGVFHYIGVDLQGDEPGAYLMTWLVNQMMDFLTEHKVKLVTDDLKPFE